MSEKSKSKNKLKTTAYEWATLSTLDGFPNIFKSKYITIKLVWFVCFLGSTAFGAYSVYGTIANYLSYQVKTTITQVFENPIEFPTVTVK